jgi:hypothetical protein
MNTEALRAEFEHRYGLTKVDRRKDGYWNDVDDFAWKAAKWAYAAAQPKPDQIVISTGDVSAIRSCLMAIDPCHDRRQALALIAKWITPPSPPTQQEQSK